MTDDDVLTAARAQMKLAKDADLLNREEALDDMRNLMGEQWPHDLKLARESDGRPCLTINRLPQFLRQVTGDLRNMNPAIKILPADSASSPDMAELFEGVVRHIQYRSDASSIYEAAGESAAACGMGFFRILTEYAGDDTFDQDIRIKGISNPFSVYFDPEARLSTREDARFCFITERMKADDFEAQYPGKSKSDAEHDGQSDGMGYWRDAGDVIVAEYFFKEPVESKIWQLPSGQVVTKVPTGIKATKERTVTKDKIMWAKISGTDVLEGPQEFPGDHIPVVAVMGEELHVGERIYRSSVIRHAKDPQRLYNYWRSAQTEVVALQPKAPYLVTPKQVAGLETFWNEANNSNRPYLAYNPDDKAGRPERSTPPVPSTGMMQEVGLAAEDMKATTGIYDAGLGQRSNEHSGVAIKQRQMESDISTSIYSDNVAKAVAQAGRIIVALIPKIYDTQRVLRIVGPDDSQDMVPVNHVMQGPEGPVTVNDMTAGKFDVRVSVGPNYTTKRQETAESMMQFLQAFPAAAPVTGDLVAKSMDWPGADQFAERLKKLLPPGFADNQGDPQQMQQAQQMQAQQAQQAQSAQQGQALQLREDMAKASKAEADAQKAQFEAQKASLELAAMRGQQMPVYPAQPGFAPAY